MVDFGCISSRTVLVVFTFTRVKVSVVVAHEPIGDGEQSGDSRVVWVKH